MARKFQVRGDGQVLGRLLRLHRQGHGGRLQHTADGGNSFLRYYIRIKKENQSIKIIKIVTSSKNCEKPKDTLEI